MTHALSCGAWPGRRGSPEDGGNRSSRVGGGGTWRGIPVRRFVAGFAPTPPKIGTAPDALSRMRYSARASELDHRRPIDPASSTPSERCFEPNFCGAGRSSSLAPRAESVCRTDHRHARQWPPGRYHGACGLQAWSGSRSPSKRLPCTSGGSSNAHLAPIQFLKTNCAAYTTALQAGLSQTRNIQRGALHRAVAEPVLKKLLVLSATNPAGALRPWGSGSLSCGRRAAFGRQPGIGRAHQRNPQWSVQDAEFCAANRT